MHDKAPQYKSHVRLEIFLNIHPFPVNISKLEFSPSNLCVYNLTREILRYSDKHIVRKSTNYCVLGIRGNRGLFV